MGRNVKLLLDTCALLWWTVDRDRLSPAATAALAAAEQGGDNFTVSSISFWELGIKLARGQLEIGTTIEDYVERVREYGRIGIVPVDERIWQRNLSLAWEHRDPADRTIVATAMLGDMAIVTADQAIAAFYDRVVW
jgi:PIN domain nuclease of toxin-antitoxin system